MQDEIFSRKTLIRLCPLLIAIALISGGNLSAAGYQNEDIDSTAGHDSTGNRGEGLSYPTITYSDLLSFQPGVVSYRWAKSYGSVNYYPHGREFHIRGGREYQTGYLLNGVLFQSPITAMPSGLMRRPTGGQLLYYPGGLAPQYGNAISGIVDYRTAGGSPKYHGTFEALSDNLTGAGFDQNWYAATITGPVPYLDRGNFAGSIERRWLGDRTPSAITDETPPGAPRALPNNWLSGYSYEGKIDWPVSNNISLNLTADYSRDGWQEYRHYFNNPTYPSQIKHTPRYDTKDLALSASLRHKLNDRLNYRLGAFLYESKYQSGDGVVFDDYNAYRRSLSNPGFDQFGLFSQGDSVFAGDINPSIEPGSPADTFIAFYESYYENFLKYRSRTIGIKGESHYDFSEHVAFSAGLDYRRYTIRYFENLDATRPSYAINVNRYGYDSLGDESNNLDWCNEAKHPVDAAVYAECQLRWKFISFYPSIRVNYYDYDAFVFRDPSRPFDPDQTGSYLLDRSDLKKASTITNLNRRLAVIMSFSDRVDIYLNHGVYYQRPPYKYLFAGWDFQEARITSGGYYPFSTAELKPEKSSQTEAGLEYRKDSILTMRGEVYYKDFENIIQVYHLNALPHSLYYYSNTDYGTSYGVYYELNLRPNSNIEIEFEVDFGSVKGTSSYAYPQYNIDWMPAGTSRKTFPLDYDQRVRFGSRIELRTIDHQGPPLAGAYPFENMRCNFALHFASGTPYTPTMIYDAVGPIATVQILPTGTINSDRKIDQFQIDISLERQLNIDGVAITPFLIVKNILDRKNVIDIYTGTGNADSCGYLESAEGQTRSQENPDFAPRYRYAQKNPLFYAAPRQIFLGVRLTL